MTPTPIADVCDSLRLPKWRRITINGRPYRTAPHNVPPGTQIGQEFRLSWRVGYVWATLTA